MELVSRPVRCAWRFVACVRGSSEIAPRITGAAQGCRVVCFLYNKPGLRCMVRSKQALVSHGKRGDPGHVRLALSWAARIEEQPLRTSSSHHRILKQADLNHTRRGSGVNLGASHGVGQGRVDKATPYPSHVVEVACPITERQGDRRRPPLPQPRAPFGCTVVVGDPFAPTFDDALTHLTPHQRTHQRISRTQQTRSLYHI